MAWEHRMAQEFRKRDNSGTPAYLTGTVVSADPLKISCYDGQVILQGSQLGRIDPWLQCSAYKSCTPKDGATCATCGTVLPACGGCASGKCLELRPLAVGQKVALAGDQNYIILGVIT